jgi:TetR/AcrR family transcriptional regulator, regulator of autoinduction and epiphytic fitness
MSRRTTLQPEDHQVIAEVLADVLAETEPRLGADRGDGRHARSHRSRRAMVDALLDLLAEGVTRPSSAQIAERAGVTQRTLFNQFGDMDSLVTAAAGRQAQRFFDLQPVAGAGTTEERVARYGAGLARLLEEVMHVRWAVVTSPSAPATGVCLVRAALQYTRRRLSEAFAPELDVLDPDTRDEVLDALELETDPVVWRLRRHQQELTVDESRAVVQRAMLAILRDASTRSEDPPSRTVIDVRADQRT